MSDPYPQPLFDRVLVERIAAPKMSEEGEGLLEIPETAQHITNRATVIRAGDDCTLDWEGGEEVVVSEYAGVEIKFKGKEYLIIRETEIILEMRADDPAP